MTMAADPIPTTSPRGSNPQWAAFGSRPVPDDLLRQIERFLYWEAFLLDERRYHEWLELFTDDVHYWMPVRRDKPKTGSLTEFATESELAFFDENKDTLTRRIAKLGTGMAWAEEPPSRTRHVVSNVLADWGETGGEVHVSSNFIVYRTRLETKQDLLVGRRDDVLRPADGTWSIAGRTILLDQTVLSADNLSLFF